ncbi:MAG: transcriptional regulator [Hyphomicrobiales bacterium]|nr:MAG: transcriptional regulator [Hyphomicrobiales bacterium]
MSENDPVINKDWFFDRLRSEKKSLRGMARHLELDASAVSRMLSGQRNMQMQEVNEIARFLNAPVTEVLKHAGVSMDQDGQATPVVLAAVIDEKGIVQRLANARPLPHETLARVRAALGNPDESVIAAQIRASTGPLAVWDDAVILFRATQRVEPEAIGAMAIVRLMDGNQYFCRIDRARKTGEASLRLTEGDILDVELDTATPVLAVVP